MCAVDDKPDKEAKGDLVPRKIAESIPDEGKPIAIGEWYWVKEPKEAEFFGCVVEVGSNYVKIENAHGSSTRVHFDQFDKTCRRELDPEKVIRGRVEHYRGVVQEKLGEIQKITARLGLTPQLNIEQHQPESSKALSVLAETDNVKQYEKALIKAQKEDLPKLFKEVEEAHKQLATWMQAQAIPMKAMAEGMQGCIGQIEDRVFNVSLYAGLTEQVAEIAKGAPAAVSDRLHILQRLLYMDEECLANYRHGGMDFKGIGKFDAWLAKPENRDRVLPFPRSLVAFRVRRAEKERDWGGSLQQAFINVEMAELDKATFLYVRNGERLYRMNCDLQFGELIFPGRHEMDLSEPMMAKTFGSSIEEIIPKREYDDRLKEHEEGVRKYEEWHEANPKKSWIENPHREHGWGGGNFGKWQPFNKSSVYYDDIKGEIENRVKYYNRIALIVQGLYDRSEVLHPHPPIRLWTPEGFAAAVELVYDGSNILSYGEAPNFEAYREACNASIKEGSITIGQDDFWQEKEAEKECKRRDNDWRVKSDHRPERFRPYGNPGPGYLARVERWIDTSRKAIFRWTRKRVREVYSEFGDPIPLSIGVPASRLFNASAYKPGDFKRFFADPRTRAQYLKWAPALIAAEEYHAGNMKVGPKHEAD